MSVRADILDNLRTELEALKDDTSYELVPNEVSPFTESYLSASKSAFPWVMILDGEPEEVAAQDDDSTVFYATITLLGLMRTDTDVELTGELNKLLSMLKKFIDAGPSLGDNVRAVQYLGTDGLRWYPDGQLGSVDAKMRIIYACERGTF